MSLALERNLDMVKMYHHTKNEVSVSTGSNSIAQTDRQTDRQTYIHTQRLTDRQTHKHYENITSTAYVAGNKVLAHQHKFRHEKFKIELELVLFEY